MKNKPSFLQFSIIIILLILFNIDCYATNLRGQVFHHTNLGNQPAANVRVDLVIFNTTNHSWQSVSSVLTGSDGFYYFLNFSPNQHFYISIGGKYYPPQQVAPIIQTVNSSSPPYYQDIPPIII
jgi:hypothetical protein